MRCNAMQTAMQWQCNAVQNAMQNAMRNAMRNAMQCIAKQRNTKRLSRAPSFQYLFASIAMPFSRGGRSVAQQMRRGMVQPCLLRRARSITSYAALSSALGKKNAKLKFMLSFFSGSALTP